MQENSPQEIFFQQLKAQQGPGFRLAEEIAGVLNMSVDSAYRRLRGEIELSFSEMAALAGRFGISLDACLNQGRKGVLFLGQYIEPDQFDFLTYLDDVYKQLSLLDQMENPMLYYECKDIPMFYYFHSRELASFKYFFWMRNILQYPSFRKAFFELDSFPEDVYEKGQKLYQKYLRIPSIEIWNIETINSTLNQIRFFQQTGCFQSVEQVDKLYTQLSTLIQELEQTAMHGYKAEPAHRFQLYFNELIMGHNTIFFDSDKASLTFINHAVLNYMATRDLGFCAYTKQHLQNMMRKSSLISSVNEMERSHFFQSMRARIDEDRRALHRLK